MDAPHSPVHRRVLVVTQDPSLSQAVGHRVAAHGFMMEHQPGAREAIAALDAHARDVAAIVCDEPAMATEKGCLLAASLRARPPIPLVLVLEKDGAETQVAALEHGVFECLSYQSARTALVGVTVRRAARRRRDLEERVSVATREDEHVREIAQLRRAHEQLVEMATARLERPAAWVQDTLDQIVKANERFIAVGDVAMTMTSMRDVDEILATIMDKATVVVDGEASALMLVDESHGDLVFRVTMGEKGQEVGALRLKIGEGLAGWVAKERQSLLIADAYDDPRFNKEFDHKTGFKTRSVLCAPLLFRDRLLGVVQAINKRHGGTFTREDLSIFNQFAAFGAIALENAKAYQKVAVERDALELRVRELEIKVDEKEKERQVQSITDSEYFVTLKSRADAIRKKL